MENKWHLAKVLPMRFHLNGHTKRFRPQTQTFTLQDLLFILGSHKYLRIMLESYFQPKIKREHEENKNVQPRAKKKRNVILFKKKERERELEPDFRRFPRRLRSILIINQCIVTSLIQYSLIRLAIVA